MESVGQLRLATSYGNWFRVALASGLGLGLSPIVPATCGTILGVLLHVLILQLPQSLQLTALTSAFLLSCAASLTLAPWAQVYWRTQDPRNFVLDEVAGYLLVVMFFHDGPMWPTIGWAFFFFRIFDVIKISPAREIDRNWHGAWGILLDDLVSAGYAAATIGLLRWLGWLWL